MTPPEFRVSSRFRALPRQRRGERGEGNARDALSACQSDAWRGRDGRNRGGGRTDHLRRPPRDAVPGTGSEGRGCPEDPAGVGAKRGADVGVSRRSPARVGPAPQATTQVGPLALRQEPSPGPAPGQARRMRQHRGVERRCVAPALRQRRPVRVRVERRHVVPVPRNRVHGPQPQHIQRGVRAGHARRPVRHHRRRRRRARRRPHSGIPIRARPRRPPRSPRRTEPISNPPLRLRRRQRRRRRRRQVPLRGQADGPERDRRRHGHEGSIRPGRARRVTRDASGRPGPTVRPAPSSSGHRRRRRGPQRPGRLQRPRLRSVLAVALRAGMRRSVRSRLRRETPRGDGAGRLGRASREIAQRARTRGPHTRRGEVLPG